MDIDFLPDTELGYPTSKIWLDPDPISVKRATQEHVEKASGVRSVQLEKHGRAAQDS